MSGDKIEVLIVEDNPGDVEKAIEKGAFCYMVKPMTIKEMERTTKMLKEIVLRQHPCNSQILCYNKMV